VLGRIVKNYVSAVRRHGVAASTRLYWDRLHERLYESRLGIRSRDIISLRELDLEREDRREHYPTSLGDFRRMERFLRPKGRDDVFLDYGSGLGRMLILAAMLPFKRVIGVELSPLLADKARENLANASHKLRCKNVEVVVADATVFEPPCDVTTIYFNNPFAGEILESVLRKIALSYQQTPRSMKLVCNLPQESAFESIIDKAAFLHPEASVDLGASRRCRAFSVETSPVRHA
jgi:predicted RNA methylase